MSTATVSIDRTSLSLSALTITDDGATYQIGYQGLKRPGRAWRKTAAPDSQDIHGSEYVAAVLEQTSIPLEVIVKGASWSAVGTAVDALADALSQFSYPVTVTTGGVSKVWSAAPADMAPSTSTDASNVAQFFQVFTITIPVYPIAS